MISAKSSLNTSPYQSWAFVNAVLIFLNIFLFLPDVYGQRAATQDKTTTSRLVRASAKPVVTQTFTEAGVAVKFSIEPVASEARRAAELLEGTHATVRFEIKEAGAGKALTNLRPAAWIDHSTNPISPNAKGCREKVQALLRSDFTNKADIDLNSYFLLTLNHEPTISVIDPFSSVGTTRLYTLVALRSPGQDWVLSDDQRRLYVSMPQVNQVAVIDTATWKVIANIDAGTTPARLALQNDERYLWVGNDGPERSGVTVIDATKLSVVAQLDTGAGHHEIGLTDDDRFAFITNKESGTLTVVDVRKLAPVKELKVGLRPTALAFSSLSKTFYIANEGDGEIVAVDGRLHEVVSRMKTRPGLHALRLMPAGRYGFVVNRAADSVSIFDISTNKLIQEVPVGPSPDQITFTRDFAYVRSTASEFVTMINLGRLGKEGNEVAVTRFPSGQKSPKDSPYNSLADVIVPAPEQGAVLVANPADKMIYFYTEGMAAPMGSFQNYRRDPRALLVLNNSLRETAPGVYTATVKLPKSGHYEVPLLLDSPRLVNCFNFQVAENPALPKEKPVAIKVEPISMPANIKVDEQVHLRFKVIDSVSKKPKANLDDLGVLVFLAPGIWQQRASAKPVGNGIYEITFVPPQAGVYYIFFQCPSLGVRYTDLQSHNLHAVSDTKSPNANETQP